MGLWLVTVLLAVVGGYWIVTGAGGQLAQFCVLGGCAAVGMLWSMRRNDPRLW